LQGSGDKMTGGVGRDVFQFDSLNEMGKVITDFQAGTGGDVLSLQNLLVSIGYVGTDPLHDGEIRLIQDGAKTELQVDSHPGVHHYVTAATLESVVATQVTIDNFLL
jgi:Ca2+-binding RTX toxin-like protein